MSHPPPEPDHARLLAWVERIANHLNVVDGIPPITGRVLGWLMVCDPSEQSAGEIAAAIGASRGSMTTNLRQLTGMGFIARVTRPGERTAYYRLVDNAWQAVVQRQVKELGTFGDIAAEGVELLGPSSERSRRVREAQELFGWLEETLTNASQVRHTQHTQHAQHPHQER